MRKEKILYDTCACQKLPTNFLPFRCIPMGARLIHPRIWLGEPAAFHAGCVCFHCLKFKFIDIASIFPSRSECRLREMWSRAVWWATSSTSTSRREQEDCGRYRKPDYNKKKYCICIYKWPNLAGVSGSTDTSVLTFPSLSASGRLSNGATGSHRGRGWAAGLWHHQEASDPVGSHGGHRVHTLFVSLPTIVEILSSLMWWLSLGGDYLRGQERFQYLKVELRNYTQQHKHHSNNWLLTKIQSRIKKSL